MNENLQWQHWDEKNPLEGDEWEGVRAVVGRWNKINGQKVFCMGLVLFGMGRWAQIGGSSRTWPPQVWIKLPPEPKELDGAK